MIKLIQNKKGYIDPGTGSVLLSTLWNLAAALGGALLIFFSKYFWKPIKKMFKAFLAPFVFVKHNMKHINDVAEAQAQPIINKLHGKKPETKKDFTDAEFIENDGKNN